MGQAAANAERNSVANASSAAMCTQVHAMSMDVKMARTYDSGRSRSQRRPTHWLGHLFFAKLVACKCVSSD